MVTGGDATESKPETLAFFSPAHAAMEDLWTLAGTAPEGVAREVKGHSANILRASRTMRGCW